MRRALLFGAAGLSLSVLSGCAGSGGSVAPTATVTETVTVGATAPEDDVASTPSNEGEATPAGAQAKFGETYSYGDGLQITVSKPAPYRPSQYAACEKGATHLVWTVTVKNGTAEPYDPGGYSDTVQSGQSEGSSCFDTAKGLEGEPSTTLLAGRTVTWKVGFGVENPNDVVMEVRPGFEYESAIFTS
jgi:hypothetical protein